MQVIRRRNSNTSRIPLIMEYDQRSKFGCPKYQNILMRAKLQENNIK